jgi:hypothetical protein
MSRALLYESLKESEVKETREVNSEESKAPKSEFKLSGAEASKEMWIY